MENKKAYSEGESSKVEQTCDAVVLCIEKSMEKRMGPTNTNSSIYRVSKQLRNIGSTTYVPQVISIGPFHRYNEDLKSTEHYKIQAFHNFLRRTNKDKSLRELVKTAQSFVEEARNCYAEPIYMNDDEFIMMMLVDGCFILEFFILLHDRYISVDHKFPQIEHNVDLSFYPGIFYDVYFDLMKLENQLPFFVLRRLFELIPNKHTPVSFKELALKFLQLGRMQSYFKLDRVPTEFGEPKHLVHLLSLFYISIEYFHSIMGSDGVFIWSSVWTIERKSTKFQFPPSITELWEAGVTFKRVEKSSMFITNIILKHGILRMSPLVIDSYFETTIRNLIAFQHFYGDKRNMYVIQYVMFMNNLIATEKDASLLVNAGIINNKIGGFSNKEIVELFNDLGKFVTTPGTNTDFYYEIFNEISQALHKKCSSRWKKSKATLEHNYFNTPWAIISFLAATLIIVLTLLQTIFSAISTF